MTAISPINRTYAPERRRTRRTPRPLARHAQERELSRAPGVHSAPPGLAVTRRTDLVSCRVPAPQASCTENRAVSSPVDLSISSNGQRIACFRDMHTRLCTPALWTVQGRRVLSADGKTRRWRSAQSLRVYQAANVDVWIAAETPHLGEVALPGVP